MVGMGILLLGAFLREDSKMIYLLEVWDEFALRVNWGR